jgi:putative ABC transport system permease protein
MLLRMAWRNLWRNVKRTLITLSAMALGAAGIVFLHSYNEAAFDEMVSTITTSLVGHLQVHGLGYQENPEVENVVRDPVAVEAKLAQVLPGATAERRVLGYALAGSENTSTAALVLGIQPERAADILHLEKGRPFSPAGPREAILGKALARQLKLEPGSEVILVGQSADGSVANDRFTVIGIGDAGSEEMNSSAVFLRLDAAQDFFGLGQGVHQLLVRLPKGDQDLGAALAAVRGAVDLKSLEALSWAQILPELQQVMVQKKKNIHFADVVVFLIVALGVMNTLLMSTFERTREFGVLASMGTRPSQILRLVLTESALQAVLGLGLGLALAAALLYGMGTTNLASMAGGEVMGVRMPTAVPMAVHWIGVKSAAITIFITAIAGSLWPAFRAARLKPVEALRHA